LKFSGYGDSRPVDFAILQAILRGGKSSLYAVFQLSDAAGTGRFIGAVVPQKLLGDKVA
jgi:hypothetical protein